MLVTKGNERNLKNAERLAEFWESPAVQKKIDRHYDRFKSGNPVISPYTPGAGSINLMSNDYLNLSRDTRIREAMISSLHEGSQDPIMSPVFLSSDSPQTKFEQLFSEYSGYEDVVLCQSGYTANDGLLQCIATPETVIYLDKFAHKSFLSGCTAAGVTPFIFEHNSLDDLERLVSVHGPGIVLVDSIYSAIGSICPLKAFAEFCSKTGCVFVVDESHTLGVYGDQGEGMVASLGLISLVPFITASLAKAFASRAGVILGSARACQYFRYSSTPAIFSSGLLPYEIAGLTETLRIIRTEGWRRQKLTKVAKSIRDGLSHIGFDLTLSHAHIIALFAGPEERVKVLRDALERRGVFGAVFCPPATPRNSTLVRLTLNCDLTESEISRILEVASLAYQDLERWWPAQSPKKLEVDWAGPAAASAS